MCDPKRWAVVRDVVGCAGRRSSTCFVTDLDAPDGRARPAAELLAADDPGALPDVAVHEDDLLAILYTSGTTGRPKGATITHRQALANLQNLACLGAIAAAQGAADAALGAADRVPPGGPAVPRHRRARRRWCRATRRAGSWC